MDGQQSPRLLDQVRIRLRYLHYSIKTEQSYLQWIRRFILFHNKRHPKNMGADEISAYLNYLATKRNVAASTQNQALNAIVFLYKQILHIEIGKLPELSPAKRPKRLPVVLTKQEVREILSGMQNPYRTMTGLLYGSGLRLAECLSLRILDIEFTRREIIVRQGKGKKDRITMLPEFVIPGLMASVQQTKEYFTQDQKLGIDYVYLPYGLSRKYPNAGKELKWQFVFASNNLAIDPVSGRRGRHHVHRRSLEKAIAQAVRGAAIMKHVTAHTFRHSFAILKQKAAYDIRTVQELMGHAHVNTTMIYTHVLNKGGRGVKSPLDQA